MSALLGIAIFLGVGVLLIVAALVFGRLIRPSLPNSQKRAIYECGEETIGSNWVQFDLRFYIVALFYLVFDVEVALIYPWAVMYRDAAWTTLALVAGLPFLGIVLIGYLYEWKTGSLDWVRSAISSRSTRRDRVDMTRIARLDPEMIEASRLEQAEPIGDETR